MALGLKQARRYLRPLRIFMVAAFIGLALGLFLHFLFKPLLNLMQQALFYRITKPLEIIQGPLSGILGGEEAVTAVYLLSNNLLVSFVAAFGGLILVKYTMKRDEEPYTRESKATNFLHRLIGEGNETYKEHSLLAFLLPLAVVFVNGAILGLFSVSQSMVWKEFVVFVAYILPHGIIEIPAVILAATIGYYHAVKLDGLLDKGEISRFFRAADQLLRSRRSWGMFSVVVIMILSAAAIETYVTPAIGRNALRRAYFSLTVENESVRTGEPAFAVLRAAYDARITFRAGAASGPEFEVSLVGSERHPFQVAGSRVEDGVVMKSSSLTVPPELPVLLFEFRVGEIEKATVIFLVAEYQELRSVANITILP